MFALQKLNMKYLPEPFLWYFIVIFKLAQPIQMFGKKHGASEMKSNVVVTGLCIEELGLFNGLPHGHKFGYRNYSGHRFPVIQAKCLVPDQDTVIFCSLEIENALKEEGKICV